MIIRYETKKDEKAIHDLNILAFGSEEESQIIDKLRESKNLILSIVAEDKGQIIGHIAFSPIIIDQNKNQKLLGLAPMAVLPEKQKLGIGSELVWEALKIIKLGDYEAVFVLGHPKYYPKFGFLPSFSNFGIKSDFHVPDDTFLALEIKKGTLKGKGTTAHYCESFS